MDNVLRIEGFKIIKIGMNFENLKKGKQNIELKTSTNIRIPKDENESEKECIVEIKADFQNEDRESILLVLLRGAVKIEEHKNNREKQDLIQKEAVPVFYNSLRGFIGELLEAANIDFTNIPPLEEFEF